MTTSKDGNPLGSVLHREYRTLLSGCDIRNLAPLAYAVRRGQSDGGFEQLWDCHEASDVDRSWHALSDPIQLTGWFSQAHPTKELP